MLPETNVGCDNSCILESLSPAPFCQWRLPSGSTASPRCHRHMTETVGPTNPCVPQESQRVPPWGIRSGGQNGSSARVPQAPAPALYRRTCVGDLEKLSYLLETGETARLPR